MRSPAHARLDVGCRTGANVIYLATHIWRATGVDFSPVAIRQARHAARAVPEYARFIEGTRPNWTHLGITRPIDLVIDMGGYHSLPHDAKRQYVC